MSSEKQVVFTKENIDLYLKEVAKAYRKLVGKSMPAELVLIGGASVLINYGFRDMTTDIDALIQAASGMQDAINIVRDKFNLTDGWLNADFKNTDSYTPKLLQYSDYYRTYSNVLSIRTVKAEYLIAMKLRSARQYKNDLSDILGILAEHNKRGTPISLLQIKRAVTDIYGGWDILSERAVRFIEDAFSDGDFEALYAKTVAGEKDTRAMLIRFEQDYPGVVKTSNVNDILHQLQGMKGTKL